MIRGNANNILVKLFGFYATIFHGDPTSFDRWRWLKRYLKPGPLRTLDAGCGSGTFTFYAAKIGNDALGISIDKRSVEVAQTRATIIGVDNARFLVLDLRNLSQVSEGLGLFDQIICFEVIEHILDDNALIAALADLLRPGGRILLTTPYKFYRHLIGDCLSMCEDGGHVRWGYTHEELRLLFDKSGLDVLIEEYISGYVSRQISNFQRFLSRVDGITAWALAFPLRTLQILDKPLTKCLHYPYLSIGVVGIKR